jgi:hypothetical protein
LTGIVSQAAIAFADSARETGRLGDWAALKRWLSVLRDTGSIAPAALLPITSRDQIFEEFGDYPRRERGLAPKFHRPRISQEDVIRYIERHVRDRSAESGKVMCWSLHAFLRYLHHRGLNPLALARLRALDQAMEAREPADPSLPLRRFRSPRWLRPATRLRLRACVRPAP